MSDNEAKGVSPAVLKWAPERWLCRTLDIAPAVEYNSGNLSKEQCFFMSISPSINKHCILDRCSELGGRAFVLARGDR
jgi:hypothetical protein